MLRSYTISFLASPSARYIRRTLNLLMKRNVLLLPLAVLVLYSCALKSEHEPTTLTTQTENDTYLHHSIWWAFVNKVFDAKLSLAEMEKKDEACLESFNVLNGEMVLLANVEVEKQF